MEKIRGNWGEGYVLSMHTEFVPLEKRIDIDKRFERTELGEMIFRLKYRGDLSQLNKIEDYISYYIEDLDMMKKIDLIIPMPSSNKGKLYEPVLKISRIIGNMFNIPVRSDILEKRATVQAKDLTLEQRKALGQTMFVDSEILEDSNVLIVDDLYGTGASMKEATEVLKAMEKVKEVFVLAMTRKQ